MPKFKEKATKALSAATALKIKRADLNPDLPRPPEIKVKLHDAVKASYGDKNGIQALTDAGYARDPILSNHNQSVFFNERTGKLIYDIAGTHNASDIITDMHLAFGGGILGGGLKSTGRYKEASDVYQKAKKKYHVEGDNVSIVGHSLGGSLASAIAEKERGVHVTTYNKGVGLGGLLGMENNHAGEKAYRSTGDVVSLLGRNKKGVVKVGKGISLNPLEAHSSSNLQNQDLFV